MGVLKVFNLDKDAVHHAGDASADLVAISPNTIWPFAMVCLSSRPRGSVLTLTTPSISDLVHVQAQ
jgi:hypothetical protein